MSTDPPASSRPLPVLRALLDAIDRDVLQLLSRRMGIVAEIARTKRHERIPIGDREREREALADRMERAEALGLPGGVIESARWHPRTHRCILGRPCLACSAA